MIKLITICLGVAVLEMIYILIVSIIIRIIETIIELLGI